MHKNYFLCPAIDSTILAREALHAGIPVLNRLRIKQNTSAQINVDQCSSDEMAILACGISIAIISETNRESCTKYANITLNTNPMIPATTYNPQNEACNASRTKRAKNKTKREAQTKRSVPSVRFFITAATLPFFKKFSPDFAGVCGLTPARLRLSPAPLHYI